MVLTDPCPDPPTLANYIAGKLDESHSTTIEVHISACTTCQAVLDNWDAGADNLLEQLRAKATGFDHEPACQNLLARVVALGEELPREEVLGFEGLGFGVPEDEVPRDERRFKAKDVPPPRELGEYVLGERIGAGGMGLVYKARQARLERVVAVKLIRKGALANQDLVQRFYREARVAAKLTHPNIVRAFDAGEHDGTHYFVMEYVDGLDLSRIVSHHGRLTVRQAVECVWQAAQGLAYAHQQGIVHRDVKPANLLLDHSGRLKLLDLGLARLARAEGQDKLTATGQVMGTVDYMAPEQAASTQGVDSRSDIYSLGCTLHKLLLGKSLYEGSTIVNRLTAHAKAKIPRLHRLRADVPQELDAIFQKMVAKRPEDRWQSMDQVVSQLQPLLERLREDAVPLRQLVEQARKGSSDGSEASSFGLPGQGPWSRVAGRQPRSWLVGLAAAVIFVTAGVAALLLSTYARRASQAGISTGQGEGLDSRAGQENPRPLTGEQADSTRTAPPSPAQSPPDLARIPFDAAKARQFQQAGAAYEQVDVLATNSLGMQLAFIPAGSFIMGATREQLDQRVAATQPRQQLTRAWLQTAYPPVEVALAKPFYLGVHEVTQSQFETVMGRNPSVFQAGGEMAEAVAGQATSSHPVDSVDFFQAVEFCNRLSDREQLERCYRIDGESVTRVAGSGYRLPTEAEWEFACRAGTVSTFYFGEDVAELDRHGRTGIVSTIPVGSLRPNPFGLYDVYGNVREWCWDGFSGQGYGSEPVTDPNGTSQPLARRVVRGGNWATHELPTFGGSWARGGIAPRGESGYRYTGFRVARYVGPATSKTSDEERPATPESRQ